MVEHLFTSGFDRGGCGEENGWADGWMDGYVGGSPAIRDIFKASVSRASQTDMNLYYCGSQAVHSKMSRD